MEPPMTKPDRNEYITRETLMKSLSDEEIASVSTAESGKRLSEGDEYLDLEHLGAGVQAADGVVIPMGRIVPRKALAENTWGKILAQLAPAKR
jgi:hypothetical protein